MLFIFVNEHLPTSNWSQDNAGTRLKSYVALYKKTRIAVNDNGGKKFMLGPEDHSQGIFTVEAKIAKLCYGYDRMDNLFGSRQNVNPCSVFQSTDCSSDEEDGKSKGQVDEAKEAEDEEEEKDRNDKDDGIIYYDNYLLLKISWFTNFLDV